ncbi:MAG: TIGR02221 family CRISPR-associated protein [Clostridium sp.]|nr:TIGR02221 family CRISPR-associated protein [Clostridium sp.]
MRKKLLTFLGAGNYEKNIYFFKEENINELSDKGIEYPFVQLSLYKQLNKDNEEDIEMIIFLTQVAAETNWVGKNGTGLKEYLEKENIKYKSVFIKDGKNTKELWYNFNTIYNELDKNDEIYIDITYSFRSLPIISLSVFNFANVVKNINVQGIYYGAYEARFEKKVNKISKVCSPIFDLSIFNDIQGWASSAEKYLTTGDARRLSDDIKKAKDKYWKENGENADLRLLDKVSTNLKKASEDILCCKGKDIPKDFKALKDSLEKINDIEIDEFTPFYKLLNMINENLNSYNNETINDLTYAVKQCYNYQLIQQGYTILLENITNYICPIFEQHDLDYKKKEDRATARTLLYEFNPRNNERKYTNEELNSFVSSESTREELTKLTNLRDEISQFRNYINHGSFNNNNFSYSILYKNLDKCLNKFKSIINKNFPEEQKTKRKCVIPIISHDLMEIQKEQLKSEWNVNRIVELPSEIKKQWENISPSEEIDEHFIEEIKEFIIKETSRDDLVIVQGEWGITYKIINICFSLGRIPIYATTDREVTEEKINGEVKINKVFKHVKFRKY